MLMYWGIENQFRFLITSLSDECLNISFNYLKDVPGERGLVAVSSGEWGSTFEKQIGRTSCGLAAALGYTRQVRET